MQKSWSAVGDGIFSGLTPDFLLKCDRFLLIKPLKSVKSMIFEVNCYFLNKIEPKLSNLYSFKGF